MDAVIRRIDIDDESAWVRVKGNVQSGIGAVMETRLAAMPGGKDGPAAKALRGELERRLGKIQQEIFKLANPNIRVNGYDYEDFMASTEPFDELLDRNIWSLHTERVGWAADVAEKRKRTPADLFRLEQNLEKRREAAEWLPEGEDEVPVGKKAADIPTPPTHQEVVETFRTVASNLSELAKNAPAQLARAQRAKIVQEEMANMPP